MKKILLVDDDLMFSQFVDATLKHTGDMCEVINNGEHILSVNLAEFDHVLLDLNIPGLDGLQVLGYLKEQGCDANISILSGSDLSVLNSAKQIATEYGLRVNRVLQKPFPVTDLISVLSMESDRPKGFCPPTPHRIHEPLMATNDVLVDGLREAIEQSDIEVYFQPKMDLIGGRLIGFEQLARWSFQGQVIPPDTFIPLAEQHGMIDHLTKVIVVKGLVAFKQFLEVASGLSLSVNISAKSLSDKNLPDYLLSCCNIHSVPTESIILELTETSLVSDDTDSLQILTRLRIMGFGLSIDDFGTGYSSISQLQKIPFTELKIDRAFIRHFATEDQSKAIVNSTINMANRLGLGVVAEGIEDHQTTQALVKNGCNVGQGYLYAKPMPEEILHVWLNNLPEEKLPKGRASDIDPDVHIISENHSATQTLIENLPLINANYYKPSEIKLLLAMETAPCFVVIDGISIGEKVCGLAKTLRSEFPSVVVLVLQDRISREDLVNAVGASIDNIVQVPLDAGELMAKFRTARKHPQRCLQKNLKDSDQQSCAEHGYSAIADYEQTLSQIIIELPEITIPQDVSDVVYRNISWMNVQVVICLRHVKPAICFSDAQQLGTETEYQVFELFKDQLGLSQFANTRVFTGKHVSIMIKEADSDEHSWTSIQDVFFLNLVGLIDGELMLRDTATFMPLHQQYTNDASITLASTMYCHLQSLLRAASDAQKINSSDCTSTDHSAELQGKAMIQQFSVLSELLR